MSARGETTEKVWAYISERQARGMFPASIREIADAVGLRSTGPTHFHMRRLEKMGHIRREPGLARAYKVLVPLYLHGEGLKEEAKP